MKITTLLSAGVLLGLGGCASGTASTAGTSTTPPVSTPVARPLHGCDAHGAPRLCPRVSLVKPPAVIKTGETFTFRGRVADPSKNFGYRISVTPGEISNSEEMTTTYHSHKGVVYPTRHWKAERSGANTVCVVGAHGASPHPVAHDCRTFAVR
jgi:hypothetical protein